MLTYTTQQDKQQDLVLQRSKKHMMQYSQIEAAAEKIRAGGLVAFPTETVYGLGANALSDAAVARIYAAKNRPTFNPLITHVPDMAAAFKYGKYIPEAERLMQKFWPGPLTIILPRREDCELSLLVSAGLDCVGLRAPNHPLAQALLRESGVPIAAPSANRSGKISPTTAAHVAEELGETCMILDDGACGVGIESTVVDLSGDAPVILRHGSVTAEMLGFRHSREGGNPLAFKSPGQLESHYAPDTKLRLNATHVEEGEIYLGFGTRNAPHLTSPLMGEEYNLSKTADLTEAAANLFAMLRALDKHKAKRIAVAPIPMEGLGIAINDRLTRAAAPR